jgi:hypothetical protein
MVVLPSHPEKSVVNVSIPFDLVQNRKTVNALAYLLILTDASATVLKCTLVIEIFTTLSGCIVSQSPKKSCSACIHDTNDRKGVGMTCGRQTRLTTSQFSQEHETTMKNIVGTSSLYFSTPGLVTIRLWGLVHVSGVCVVGGGAILITIWSYRKNHSNIFISI